MEKCNYLAYGAIFPGNSAKSVVVERISDTEVKATEIPLNEFTKMRDKGKLELSLEFPNGNREADLVSSGEFADPIECDPNKLCCLETSEVGGNMPLVFGDPRVFIGVSLLYHPEAGLAFGGIALKRQGISLLFR